MSKRFGFILVVLLVLSAALTACSTESKDAAQDYVEAVLKGKADKAEEYACDSYQDQTAVLAAFYGAIDIQKIDLKYDIGKGGNEEEVIVSGAYEVGKGDDAKEFELAASIRADPDDEDNDEMIDTRWVLEMEKSGDDWCVVKVEIDKQEASTVVAGGEAEEEVEEPEAAEEAVDIEAESDVEAEATETAE
jgi:hypothetical protein